MSSQWKDISIPLRAAMVHWPGDPKVQIRRTHDMAGGDACNVSKITMGSHTGTHMDAPSHFIKRGKTIDMMSFDMTIGKARVIEIKDPESIKPSELMRHNISKEERILFKTKNSSQAWKLNSFCKNFVFLTHEAAQFLSDRKIKTVGIDYLSVGGYKQDGNKTHRILLDAGIWIIEGLNLSRIPSGRYELTCLPLRWEKGDGAPARAILKQI